MKPQQKWNLKNGMADFDLPGLRLKVDTSSPESGGQVEFASAAAADTSSAGGAGCSAAMFQLRGLSSDSKAAAETYCRGRDLITRYAADESNPIARELYWRLADHSDDDSQIASVETIYSLQTDLLDSAPQPSVPSVFSNASIRWFQFFEDAQAGVRWNECSWDDACFAAGEGDSRVACVLGFKAGNSLLQTVFPSDLRGIEISTSNDQTEIHWLLRADFLEKGVIRRLRTLTVLGGGDASDQDLLDAASRFYSSELPLTV